MREKQGPAMVSWDEARPYNNETPEKIIVYVLIDGYWKRVMSEKAGWEALAQEGGGVRARW